MSTSPIDALAATAAGGSSLENAPPTTSISGDNSILDRAAFLKLLVAQLKYQDPTNPADSSEMLAQTAQLTMVDNMNQLLKSYNEAASAERLSLAGTIVGKDISFVDPNGAQVTARVTSARFEDGTLILDTGEYTVPYDAVSAVHAPAVPDARLATLAANSIPA